MDTVVQSAAFRSFAFYVGILMLKMFAMGILTALVRMRKRVVPNPEDLMSAGYKLKLDDPDVERVRRAHRNDLENILPFFALGFLYCCTQPNLGIAHIVFTTFTLSRIAHTLVYAIYPVALARSIAFTIGFGTNIYMSLSILAFYL